MVGRRLLREILGQPTPVGAESPIFSRYLHRSASAITPSEKKFN